MAGRSNSIAHPLPLHEAAASSLRSFLKKIRLLFVIRIARLFIHFGPWRRLAMRIIRILRPPIQENASDSPSVLPPIDPKFAADQISEKSVFLAGSINENLLHKLTLRTQNLPADHYKLIHLVDPDIKQLSEDPTIKAVLRNHLKCEPVLLEATLTVTEGAKFSSQNSFHFDYAGWKSLNVFVYLTDVSNSSPYHMVATGSHKDVQLRDLLKLNLTDTYARERFGNRIKPITGEAGTLFFENTEAFHCRNFSPERRVLLNMLYASHRSLLSLGRTTNKHAQKRASVYLEGVHKTS